MTEVKHVHPILVNISYSATVNIGNYESRKYSVSITMPAEKGSLKKVYKQLKETVMTLVEKEAERIKEEALQGGEDVFEEEELSL